MPWNVIYYSRIANKWVAVELVQKIERGTQVSLEVLEELKRISINWQRWDVSVIDLGFDDEWQLYIFAQANLMVNKFFNKILSKVTFPNGSTINF